MLSFFDPNLDFLKLFPGAEYRRVSLSPCHPPAGRDAAHDIELRRFALDADSLEALVREFAGRTAFALAAPPCPGLVLAGARWWAAKAEEDPHFQRREADGIVRLHGALRSLGCAFAILVPATGRLQALWRRPQFAFDPCDYGGYLPRDDGHPYHPAVFPPRDAYKKLTAAYTSVGLEAPPPRPVKPIFKELKRTSGGTRMATPTLCSNYGTTSVRSCLPRGFLRAISKRVLRPASLPLRDGGSAPSRLGTRVAEHPDGLRVLCCPPSACVRVRVSVRWSP